MFGSYLSKKMKRTVRVIILTVFMDCILGFTPVSFAFRDVTSEVEKAVREFDDEGMFGFFLYKYGHDLFRPEGSVARSDLILLLKEYHILTRKLLSHDREIMTKLDELESSDTSSNMDEILREFQNVLDPMLKNSRIIKNLRQSISPPQATTGGPAVNAEISKLREEVDELSRKINTEPPGSKVEASPQNINRDSRISKTELKELKEDIKKVKIIIFDQQRKIDRRENTGLSIVKEEIIELEKKYAEIDKYIENLEKKFRRRNTEIKLSEGKKEDSTIFKNGSRELETRVARLEKNMDSYQGIEVAEVSSAELDILKRDLVRIKAVVAKQQKDIDKVVRNERKTLSAGGKGIPFWTKLSMGFSTLILFFMAR